MTEKGFFLPDYKHEILKPEHTHLLTSIFSDVRASALQLINEEVNLAKTSKEVTGKVRSLNIQHVWLNALKIVGNENPDLNSHIFSERNATPIGQIAVLTAKGITYGHNALAEYMNANHKKTVLIEASLESIKQFDTQADSGEEVLHRLTQVYGNPSQKGSLQTTFESAGQPILAAQDVFFDLLHVWNASNEEAALISA